MVTVCHLHLLTSRDRRDRDRGDPYSFPEKKDYNPDIKITYTDDLGRELQKKEVNRTGGGCECRYNLGFSPSGLSSNVSQVPWERLRKKENREKIEKTNGRICE